MDSIEEKNHKKGSDGFEIYVENIEETDGYWTLDKNQFVPAVIHWRCPICKQTNVRDCRWEFFQNPPLNNNFPVSLICNTPGCSYVRAVMLKIKMTLSLEEVAPMTVEEFNILENIYNKEKKNEALKQFMKKGHRGLFLKSNK